MSRFLSFFISEKIGGPTIKEKKELADKMAHSTNQQEIYNKINGHS